MWLIVRTASAGFPNYDVIKKEDTVTLKIFILAINKVLVIVKTNPILPNMIKLIFLLRSKQNKISAFFFYYKLRTLAYSEDVFDIKTLQITNNRVHIS